MMLQKKREKVPVCIMQACNFHLLRLVVSLFKKCLYFSAAGAGEELAVL